MNVEVDDWFVADRCDDVYAELDIAAVAPLRRMADEDYVLGAKLYAMVRDWSGWVHRRVERVTFDDPVSSQRHVSIDCTLRTELEVPIAGEPASDHRPGHRLFYVPLSMHLKHRVTRLSVRDEAGSPIPILTQARCAYFGTATLAVAAMTVWIKTHDIEEIPDEFELPPDVLADLDYIATQHWRLAVARWAMFPFVPSPERTLEELRRRVPGGNPETTSGPGQSLRPLTSEALLASRNWRQLLTDPDNVASKDFFSLAYDFARHYLMLARVWDDGRRRRVFKVSFEEQRRVPRPYVLSTLRRRPMHAPGGRQRSWRAASEAGGASAPNVGTRHRRRERPPLRWLTDARTLRIKGLRALAIRPKVYGIPAPAVAHCECYHLEVDVPDGLQVTGARLRAVTRDVNGRPRATHVDKVERSVQRVHLHLAGVPQGRAGDATVWIRPRAWNVLLAAAMASMLTVVLLSIIGMSWDAIAGAETNAPALLLALPAGLGFFVARRVESGLVTASLRGARVLAFLTGAWALGGAAVMVADPTCATDVASGLHWLWSDHLALNCAPDFLWVLAFLALLNLIPLALATWRSLVPPLRLEIDEQDFEDFDLGESETAAGQRSDSEQARVNG